MSNVVSEYNNEPVYYCRDCLSLLIKTVPNSNIDYCDVCGSTSIETTNIFNWENLYEQRYGHKFLTNNKKWKRRRM